MKTKWSIVVALMTLGVVSALFKLSFEIYFAAAGIVTAIYLEGADRDQ